MVLRISPNSLLTVAGQAFQDLMPTFSQPSLTLPAGHNPTGSLASSLCQIVIPSHYLLLQGLPELWAGVNPPSVFPWHSILFPLMVITRLEPPWGAKQILLISVYCLANNRDSLNVCMNMCHVFCPFPRSPLAFHKGGSTNTCSRQQVNRSLFLALPWTKHDCRGG